MPLNIDWQQIVLHLFNFFLLVLVLYVLVYKPVVKFMASREQYFQDKENQANERILQAEQIKSENKKRLENIQGEIENIKNEKMKRIHEESQKHIEESKIKGQEIIDRSHEKAERDREKLLSDAKKEIKEIALEASKKISDGDKDLIDQFIEASTLWWFKKIKP